MEAILEITSQRTKMPRIILETLTGKQLAAFALVMLAAQITFFFIGLKGKYSYFTLKVSLF